MNCCWTDYHLENVDIQVLLTIGIRDTWNNSTFHGEFGGHFVFQFLTLSRTVKKMGGGPRLVVSTAAFHARVRGSVPGLGGLKETKNVSSPSTCETHCGEPP